MINCGQTPPYILLKLDFCHYLYHYLYERKNGMQEGWRNIKLLLYIHCNEGCCGAIMMDTYSIMQIGNQYDNAGVWCIAGHYTKIHHVTPPRLIQHTLTVSLSPHQTSPPLTHVTREAIHDKETPKLLRSFCFVNSMVCLHTSMSTLTLLTPAMWQMRPHSW